MSWKLRGASLFNEETHQLRAIQLAVGASRSRVDEAERSTIVVAVIAEDITEGVSTTQGAVPSNQTRLLVDRRRFTPQVCLTYHLILCTFMHYRQFHVFLLGLG